MDVKCFLNDYAGVSLYEAPKRQIIVMNTSPNKYIKIKIDDEIIEVNASKLKKAIDNCTNV